MESKEYYSRFDQGHDDFLSLLVINFPPGPMKDLFKKLWNFSIINGNFSGWESNPRLILDMNKDSLIMSNHRLFEVLRFQHWETNTFTSRKGYHIITNIVKTC